MTFVKGHKANVTHGLRRTREYKAWAHAKQRCTNPNHIGWPLYGGRGIRMCDRWLNDFAAFYADMGPKPTPEHSLDRINLHGDYAPGNCRWATPVQQVRNSRATKLTPEMVEDIRKSTRTTRELAEHYGVTFQCVWNVRKRRSWHDDHR